MRLSLSSLWCHYNLRTASEMKSDLRFEFNIILFCLLYGPFLQPPRPLQPQRSNPTTYLESVTLITHASMLTFFLKASVS